MKNVIEIPQYPSYGLPCFCHFGYISAHHKPHDPNWHKDVEILACTKGEGFAEYDGEKIFFSKGEIVVINSDVSHRILTDSHIEYFYLQIDPVFQSENGIETEGVLFETKICDDEMYEIYMRIVEITHSDDKYRLLKLRIACSQLLLLLIEKYIKPVEALGEAHEIVHARKAMEYIRYNYFNTFTVGDVAEYVGINRTRLTKEFKKYTGTTVLEQVNSVRCKFARKMILGGVKISEAARRCGFDNKSYFTKTYKKYIGALPTETQALIYKK